MLNILSSSRVDTIIVGSCYLLLPDTISSNLSELPGFLPNGQMNLIRFFISKWQMHFEITRQTITISKNSTNEMLGTLEL